MDVHRALSRFRFDVSSPFAARIFDKSACDNSKTHRSAADPQEVMRGREKLDFFLYNPTNSPYKGENVFYLSV